MGVCCKITGGKKMPWGDRTGPRGQGPMTGRGAGYCGGYNMPGYTNPAGGRGFGRGFGQGYGRGYGRGGFGGGYGRGRGYGRGYDYPEPAYYPSVPVQRPPSSEEEKDYLTRMVQDLESELKSVKNRIKELAKSDKDK